MTPQYIALVQSTIPVLRENGVALTSYFYQRMLKNHPELKNVFNLDDQSSGRQPRALAAAVLAYAEHIENPTVLAKAIERIATKHVSLDIRPEQYQIVGENLLHSISEVLNVPFESELIEAWKTAYLQLADILIQAEQQKYENLSAIEGGWSGWRRFRITQIDALDTGKRFTLQPTDGKSIIPSEAGFFVSLKVKVPQHSLEQPKSFHFDEPQNDQVYQILVSPENQEIEYSVSNILLSDYQIGDEVELSAPQKI